ncbi:hypothetical protein PFISCL1PPCAC_16185, partial [Pristionchus fissidentatus]
PSSLPSLFPSSFSSMAQFFDSPPKFALVTGVSDKLTPDGRQQIGQAVAEVLAKENYIVFVVCDAAVVLADTVKTMREYSPRKGILEGPKYPKFGGQLVDMNDVDSVRRIIRSITAYEYDLVIFNLHFDPDQSTFPNEPLSMAFKVNILNHWLIASAVKEKGNPRFVILPSVPKGLSTPLTLWGPTESLPLNRDAIDEFFRATRIGRNAHYYTRLAAIAMGEVLRKRGLMTCTMYPDDVEWYHRPITEYRLGEALFTLIIYLSSFLPRRMTDGVFYVPEFGKGVNPWARKVLRSAIRREVERGRWLRGEERLEHGLTDTQIDMFGRYLDNYSN